MYKDIDLTCPQCELRDKHTIAQEYYNNFINRLDSMFKYEGLPETIPAYILERYLKINGWAGIGKAPETSDYKGQLVCFFGGIGAKPDLYYQPTEIMLANPVLGSKTYKIGKDVVWGKNDSLAKGVSHILSRYAHLIADNDISINIAQITTRAPFVFTAETSAEVESAKAFISDLEKGKIGVTKSAFFNKGLTPMPLMSDSSGGYIKSLIELHQYLKAQWANDLGIGSNFNMKRERLNTAEVESNSPYLLPLVDEMLKFRKIMCDEVNAMFGESWSVSLDSAWELEDVQQTLEAHELENPESFGDETQTDSEKEDKDEDVS